VKIKQLLKLSLINLLVSLYKPFSIRTFFHTISYLELAEIRKSSNFISKFLGEAALFDDKKGGYWSFCMEKVSHQSSQGMWIEFGVRDGVSTKYFSPYAKKYSTNGLLYGFDSFQGIRNSWSSVNEPAGSFSRSGKQPNKISGCEFIVGWIEDTLGPFLDSNPQNISFVHFDLDVYAPTKFALSLIKKRLQPGALILFDEFHGYPGWELNEKKALEEIFNSDDYKFIAFSRKQAAIQII